MSLVSNNTGINFRKGGTLDALTEKTMQKYILNYLSTNNGFIVKDNAENFDAKTALDIKTLWEFVSKTQPEVISFLEECYTSPLEELENLVVKTRDKIGTLSLIRNGITNKTLTGYAGPDIKLGYAEPISSLNQDLHDLYAANIFTVMEEVAYEPGKASSNRIDIGIFFNGIPIMLAELKNELTGQNAENAVTQWKTSRNNTMPVLKPLTGSLVFFAIGREQAYFSTKLMGRESTFFPFNIGDENGAGNPPVDDFEQAEGYRTYYLWQNVWTKENLTNLIFNLIYHDAGKDITKAKIENVKIVFPRYHQLNLLDKVRNTLIQNMSIVGEGQNFLIQHSAGSGKTFSITWLGYMLSGLTNPIDDAPLYDKVIIITDRKVVDKQLREEFNNLNQTEGQLGVVYKNAAQLKDFLQDDGIRVVVSTIQKFSFIEELAAAGVSRYAVIIDEAHSGQGGENSINMVDLIGASTELSKTNTSNIDFFAFTATPREETIARFGNDGKAYDVYSMKQAIEEQFILNVLKNYITYTILNRLKNDGENKKLPSSAQSKRALNEAIRSSEVNLVKKAEVIVDHMTNNGMSLIKREGKNVAKGMVVTSSREEAYKLFNEIKKLTATYPEIKPIIAFTGDLDINGETYNERNLNGFASEQIPTKFKKEYNLLIVADKFQTGFDENLLAAMYVDKKLSGITAVQTLSRLNRAADGKREVVVVDFQDNTEEVREAFAKYNVEARLRDIVLPDLAAEAQKIYDYKFFTQEQVIKYFKSYVLIAQNREDTLLTSKEQVVMSNILLAANAACGKKYRSTNEDDQDTYFAFIRLAKNFIDDYTYISQFRKVEDSNMKALAVFLRLLERQRPAVEQYDQSWLEDISVEIVETIQEENDISIDFEYEPVPVRTIEIDGEKGQASPTDKEVTIEELVKEYNDHLRNLLLYIRGTHANEDGEYDEAQRLGVHFTVLENIVKVAKDDEQFVKLVHGKSYDLFKNDTSHTLAHTIILNGLVENLNVASEQLGNEGMAQASELITNYSNNSTFRSALQDAILHLVYLNITKK